MKWVRDKRPVEESAAPLAELSTAPDTLTPLLTEIRDQLKEQNEFNAWLKEKLIAAGTFGN